MEIKQIYSLVNDAIKESTGQSDLLKDDLSNLVDVGASVLTSDKNVDSYAKALINCIGKMVFVARPYGGYAPSVMMDSWEYGSIVEKVKFIAPEAEKNDSWDLTDGTSYDQDIFKKPQVTIKLFNKKTTFEVPLSITDIQIKQSFHNASEMNSFISMLYVGMDNSMTEAMDELVIRAIDNMIGETIKDEYYDTSKKAMTDLGAKSGIRAVNLLKLYNSNFNKSLKASDALGDVDFLRYSGMVIRNYTKRLEKMSTLFNVGKQKKFTYKDLLHVIMLSDFVSATSTYLESSTFNKELVALPKFEEVGYWQGTGTDYSKNSQLHIVTAKDQTEINVTGKILGVMFDRDALGVSNWNRRTTTHRNEKAEFTNMWYKMDVGFYNDLDENFVVFFIQDAVGA